MRVLLVNHKQERCGIYQHGLRMYQVLADDPRYELSYVEAENDGPVYEAVAKNDPDYIFYNWYGTTMGWLSAALTYSVRGKNIFFHHEGELPYHLNASAYVMANMTENVTANIYSLPRVIFEFDLPPLEKNDIVNVGSFGFAFPYKGFSRVVEKVNEQFDEAVVNLHMTPAYFNSMSDIFIANISSDCQAAATKPGVRVNITTNFMSDFEVVAVLRRNDINLFLYDYQDRLGISSAPDYAVSTGRPFGVSGIPMFSHILGGFPGVNADLYSINSIIGQGDVVGDHFRKVWSHQALRDKFYDILVSV